MKHKLDYSVTKQQIIMPRIEANEGAQFHECPFGAGSKKLKIMQTFRPGTNVYIAISLFTAGLFVFILFVLFWLYVFPQDL